VYVDLSRTERVCKKCGCMETFQGRTDECCRKTSGNECEFTDDYTCDGRGLSIRFLDDVDGDPSSKGEAEDFSPRGYDAWRADMRATGQRLRRWPETCERKGSQCQMAVPPSRPGEAPLPCPLCWRPNHRQRANWQCCCDCAGCAAANPEAASRGCEAAGSGASASSAAAAAPDRHRPEDQALQGHTLQQLKHINATADAEQMTVLQVGRRRRSTRCMQERKADQKMINVYRMWAASVGLALESDDSRDSSSVSVSDGDGEQVARDLVSVNELAPADAEAKAAVRSAERIMLPPEQCPPKDELEMWRQEFVDAEAGCRARQGVRASGCQGFRVSRPYSSVGVPHGEDSWCYLGGDLLEWGPFSTDTMRTWFKIGIFRQDTMVRRHDWTAHRPITETEQIVCEPTENDEMLTTEQIAGEPQALQADAETEDTETEELIDGNK